jgi:hypothetical protein
MVVQHNARNERISLEEYFALLERDPEHRYEYLNGYIYMMTVGTPDHSIIGNNVGRILGNLLQGRRCIVYNSDLYVELSDNYRVCPDVTVSCDPRDRGAKEAIRYPSLISRSPLTHNRSSRSREEISALSFQPNHSRILAHRYAITSRAFLNHEVQFAPHSHPLHRLVPPPTRIARPLGSRLAMRKIPS